jgi:hypothetical protein
MPGKFRAGHILILVLTIFGHVFADFDHVLVYEQQARCRSVTRVFPDCWTDGNHT